MDHRHSISAFVAAGLLCACPASAAETQTFHYDALGRLVRNQVSGPSSGDKVVEITHDRADNRSNFTVSNTATCAYKALDNLYGNEEFAVSVLAEKSGTCSSLDNIGYTIQNISGVGQYNVVSFGSSGNGLYKVLNIQPINGTFVEGNPLHLQITWTVTSGSVTITDNPSDVTICSQNGC